MRNLFSVVIALTLFVLSGCERSAELPAGILVAEVKDGSAVLQLDQPRLWGLVSTDFLESRRDHDRRVILEEIRIEGEGEHFHLVADGQLDDGNDYIKAYPLMLVKDQDRSVLLFPEDGA